MLKAHETIRKPGGLPKRRAVTALGKHPGSLIWAVGPNIFINGDTGELFDAMTCEYVWLDRIYDPPMKLLSTKCAPQVSLPLSQNFQPLIDLTTALRLIFGATFVPALAMLAGVAIGLSYQELIEQYEFCTGVIVTGTLSCGKTTSLQAALSTLGRQQTCRYAQHHFVLQLSSYSD